MESPDGHSTKHSIKFGFRASNNVIEYEEALTGLYLSQTFKEKMILIKSDSLLVVRQSTSEIEAREGSMKQYQKVFAGEKLTLTKSLFNKSQDVKTKGSTLLSS